jgi:L-threonylcarbamoyladenylate synthase
VSRREIARAVDLLRAGRLVAFPTETVYGLGANAADPDAVGRIYEVKGRPQGHPLIVHVASATQLLDWACDVPAEAHTLAQACWPGPLTMLLSRHPGVSDMVTGGQDSIGLRVPAHPLALDLLRAFDGGVAAPSANRFGRVSPTTADHVRVDLGPAVDLVLDGGPCPLGVESTIIDLTLDPPVILRPGGIAAEQIAAILGRELRDGHSGPSRAPGMLASHYAPRAALELVADATTAGARVQELRAIGRRAEVLDPGPDSRRYAHELYTWLREADDRHLEVLVVVPPPPDGLGRAVRDRLEKAAAPRGGRAESPGADSDAT